MTELLVDSLAEFSTTSTLGRLPAPVIDDSKRVLLDSIGCAFGGLATQKGAAAVKSARVMSPGSGPASVFGLAEGSSVFAAAFANGETLNALDFDAVLPPGHVAPYVIPGALSIAEAEDVSGARLIQAVAVGHEMSHRFGKAMDYLRTPKGNDVVQPGVLGYAATVFGAAAANSIVLGHDVEKTANSIGIAGAVSPVNAHRSWIEHVPSTSIKYTMAGPLVTAGLTAAFSAEFGHSGDREILDDADFGYARFIGTSRWVPTDMTDGMGEDWLFPRSHSYKLYPHCRVTHAPLDAFTEILTRNEIAVDEIDAIRCWGESWIRRPMWMTTDVGEPHLAQMSVAFAFAAAAHRLPLGSEWYSEETLASRSVKDVMSKVAFEAHPGYRDSLVADPSARPSAVEVDARGQTFRAERSHPRGSPTADSSTYATTDELVEKFRGNAAGIISDANAERLVEGLLDLENVDAVSELLAFTRGRAVVL